ncbi:MAG: HD domain-containing phosphohydrolase [Nitrospirota bacterium]
MTETSRPSRPTILIVDEEPHIRQLIIERLQQEGFDCQAAASEREALTRLEREDPFDLMACNIKLESSGLQLLTAVRSAYPDMAVVMMAALSESRLAVEAMRLGAADYVVKPFSMEGLVMRIRSALERRRLLLENRLLREEQARHRRREAGERSGTESDPALQSVTRALAATVETLALALDHRNQAMRGHMRRVAAYTEEMARAMGINGHWLEMVRHGAMLHDVGFIAIPDAIVTKPEPLNDAELAEMKRHVNYGYQVLKAIDFFRDSATMVLHHHERYDGRGYPAGVAGNDIAPGARIFAVADAFDAMTSSRPYRRALSYDDACADLIRCSGSQFDPAVIEAFFTVPRTRWLELSRQSERAVHLWQGEC